MSIVQNSGVQVQEYVYDFSVDTGAVAEYNLASKAGYAPIPVGAVITDVIAYVETAVTTSASGTLAFGNGDNKSGFMAAVAAASLGANAVLNAAGQDSALLWDGTNDHMIPIYVADAADGTIYAKIETGALTAGKVRLLVFYVAPKRDV
jgi:hypothetical protein